MLTPGTDAYQLNNLWSHLLSHPYKHTVALEGILRVPTLDMMCCQICGKTGDDLVLHESEPDLRTIRVSSFLVKRNT